MSSATRLKQQGYKLVASFNHKEQADERAAFMKKLGHKARVVKGYNSFGDEIYSIYFKAQEV